MVYPCSTIHAVSPDGCTHGAIAPRRRTCRGRCDPSRGSHTPAAATGCGSGYLMNRRDEPLLKWWISLYPVAAGLTCRLLLLSRYRGDRRTETSTPYPPLHSSLPLGDRPDGKKSGEADKAQSWCRTKPDHVSVMIARRPCSRMTFGCEVAGTAGGRP